MCKLRKRRVKQREKLYYREVVYRLLDCIVAKNGTVVKGSEAVYLSPWQPGHFLLIGHPVGEVDRQLRMYHTPILPSAGPFFCNVHHGKIEHFEQTVVGRKHRFRFCDLAAVVGFLAFVVVPTVSEFFVKFCVQPVWIRRTRLNTSAGQVEQLRRWKLNSRVGAIEQLKR